MKLTKAELQRKTKTELTAMAKSKFKLKTAASATKDQLIAALQKAQTAAAKKTVKKKTTVKKSAKKVALKKSTAKKSKAKSASIKTTVKKSAKKVGKSTTPVAKRKPLTSKKKTSDAPKSKDRPLHRPELSAEDIISESKYHVAEVSEETEFFDGLRESYEDNRTILLVRDPFFVFSSWDLEKNLPARTAEQNGVNLDKGKIVLRTYDVTNIEFNGHNGHSHFDHEPNSVIGSWYIEVPRDDASYIVEVGVRDEFGNFYMMSRSNVVTTPRATASTRLDEEWMMADDDFWKIYRLSGGFKPGGSSENLASQMSRHLMQSVSSGGFSGGSESLMRKRDDFPFTLDCELIVHGKTNPDAKVTLKGREIKLKDDGTFAERYTLPDGLQVIDATAQSANRQHEKTITPTISRSTASLNTGREGSK